jgi:protein disulfide-isomerase A6
LTKALQPNWEAAAQKMKGKVFFGKVNCDEEQSTCQKFGVKGYPTIKVFKPESRSASDAEDYNGGRDEKELINQATDYFTRFGGKIEIKQIVSQDFFNKECLESNLSTAPLP